MRLHDSEIKDSDDETSNVDPIDLKQQTADDDSKWIERWTSRLAKKLDSKPKKIDTQKKTLVAL